MIKEWIHWIVAYMGWIFDTLLAQIMTIEGLIAILFGLFLAGFISRLRS